MKRVFFLLCLVGVGILKLKGQVNDSAVLDINVSGISVVGFINTLEKQTGLFFYYDLKQLDSITINVSLKQQTLSSILGKAFEGTGLYSTIDNKGNVFITKDRPLDLSLLTNSQQRLQKRINPLTENENPEQEEPVINNSLENKVYEIGNRSSANKEGTVTLAGYVKDFQTGEPIVSASVFIDKLNVGTVTDQYGYYSLSLPRGRFLLHIESVGMKDKRSEIHIYESGKMNIELQTEVPTLKGVIVSGQKTGNVKGTQMGVQKIDIKTIKQVPVVFGEADLLRVVTTLPGVKTVGEASTGLNVRGGSADQNLILFNDATIYNPSHFFGMFSAFNPELVKDVELYKSSIPPRYGGRLSSVLNINGREGNKKNLTGSAGLGLLTSRLNLEGPLIKDKSSFIVGGRTTYANWLLGLLPDQYKNSKASFYDLNMQVSHEINKNNSIYLTGYLSKDQFNLNSDTVYGYGNKNISLKWKHIFNNKLNSLITTGCDRYEYNITSDKLPKSAYELEFDINQTYLRTHFDYYLNSKHTLDFGFNALYYQLSPGSYQPLGEASLVMPDNVPDEQALETAAYIGDRYNITKELSIEGGLRFSLFSFLGPKEVAEYEPFLPRNENNRTNLRAYGKGDFIKTYGGPEYRFSARYAFNDSFSVKMGYNTQRQYIHSISNTAAMAPTDIWKLSDPNIKPQLGNQISLGLYKNLRRNTIETSVEVYYKNIENFLDFKSGAVLIMNDFIETDVLGTKGKAYGVELFIKKATGKLNGWISYTWSRILLKMDDPASGEQINKGMLYPANYDKPHDLTIIGNYRINHRFSLSLNGTYSTGRPITLPVGRYYYAGSARTLYEDRNAYRIPDYMRADFSINIEGNHKVHQKFHNSWTIGVYNVTGRRNPYSVYYTSEAGVIKGYKLSIFGSAIPYVNYNIRF